MLTFSQHLVCPTCGTSYDEPAPRNFSFNSPYGACATCDGSGHDVRGRPRAAHPRQRPEHQRRCDRAVAQRRHAVLHAHARGGRRRLRDRPRRAVPDAHGQAAEGHPARRRGQPEGEVQEPLRAHRASTRTAYEGVIPWIKRRHEGAESDWSREQYEGYMRLVPCPACDGRPAEAGHAGGHGQRARTSPRCATCRSASRRSSSPRSS